MRTANALALAASSLRRVGRFRLRTMRPTSAAKHVAAAPNSAVRLRGLHISNGFNGHYGILPGSSP
jgi:hypothetical protein